MHFVKRLFVSNFAASKINQKGGLLNEKENIRNSVLCKKNKTIEK